MKLKTALWLLAAATVGVGAVGIEVSQSAERTASCEVAVNQKTLELILLLQAEARMAVDIAERRNARRLYELAGKPQPRMDELLERLARRAIATNEQALKVTDDVKGLLEAGCDEERTSWVRWSLFLTVLTAGLSCLGLWLGLKISDGGEAPREETDPANSEAKT